jgi:hypothetical protein
MFKRITLIGVIALALFCFAIPAFAANEKVHYLVPAEFDSTITGGVAETTDGSIILKNATNTNTTTIKTGAATGSYTLTLPVDDGTSGQALITDGDGVLSWSTVSAGSTAYDDIGDPDASGSISFGAHTGTYTSSTADWGGLIVENSSATPTAGAALLSLKYTADGDADGDFLKLIDNAGADVKFKIGANGVITLANGETIDNSTDGTIKLTGKAAVTDDVELNEGKKVILNADDGTAPKTTYIVANADDTVSFFKNSVEVMRFE